MIAMYVKVDEWVRDVLRDPLDKTPLNISDGFLLSRYGARYRIRNGIYDLRLLKCKFGPVLNTWASFQDEGEKTTPKIQKIAGYDDYFEERERDSKVYEAIPIIGRCLDVGGSTGRIRVFMEKDQEYLCIDPFIGALDYLEKAVAIKKAYPCMNEKMNFICGFAEHLPLAALSFDHVHMRSIIDHVYNPELAVAEAYRVLNFGGTLVAGQHVIGGQDGIFSSRQSLKRMLKYFGKAADLILKDHHIWQPTYREMITLLEDANFTIDKVHWMKGIKDVCYIKAKKEHL